MTGCDKHNSNGSIHHSAAQVAAVDLQNAIEAMPELRGLTISDCGTCAVLERVLWSECGTGFETLVLKNVGASMDGLDTFDRQLTGLVGLRSLTVELDGQCAAPPWVIQAIPLLPVELTHLRLRKCNSAPQVFLDSSVEHSLSLSLERMVRSRSL